MIYLVQLFSTILAVMVIGKSYTDYKKRNESLVVFIFWALTWLAIVFFAYFPQTIDLISQRFDGQTSGVNRVIGLGLTFLFFIIYRVFVKAERIERQLGQLIKQGAMRDLRLVQQAKNKVKSRS